MASEGRIVKPDKDFTAEVDKQLPEARELADVGIFHCVQKPPANLQQKNIQSAVEKLSLLEKQTRQASDLASTSRLLVGIVTLCKEKGDWPLMNEQVLLLSKKHGQLKQAITKMVQVVMGFLPDTPNVDTKLSVIETLRTVTEGKIFVEVERARVTRILSDLKKDQGDLASATDILCELQVETFGSMERREKTEFILQQVELCIEKGDWTQASILSRKINTRYFNRKPVVVVKDEKKESKPKPEIDATEPHPEKEKADDDVTDLKMKYYQQQIMLAKHDKAYLEVCKHYRQVLDTPAIENNPTELRAVLQRIIWYIILAPHNNEQSDLLHRIAADTRNTQVKQDSQLLKLFTVPELMRWPLIESRFGPDLCKSEVFARTASSSSTPDQKAAHERFESLRHRVIEHNVRVVAKYYTRIRMPRLCQLLDLDEGETERYLSNLVTDKTIYAKIDRPAGVVAFAKTRSSDEVMNEWSSDTRSLLGLLERIDHLITKEEMMARIQPGAKGKVR